MRRARGARREGACAAAFLLAASFALLLGAGTAQAQLSAIQVKNTRQRSTGTQDFSRDRAQRFTTGSAAAGYRLTRVDLYLRATSAPTYTVKIYNDSSGVPGTSLGTLTNPTLESNLKLVAFTAPGSGVALDANTTYWVVLEVTTGGAGQSIGVTSSDAEDSGAKAGWSIGNSSLSAAGSGWIQVPSIWSFRLSILGHPKLVPTAPSAPGFRIPTAPS